MVTEHERQIMLDARSERPLAEYAEGDEVRVAVHEFFQNRGFCPTHLYTGPLVWSGRTPCAVLRDGKRHELSQDEPSGMVSAFPELDFGRAL